MSTVFSKIVSAVIASLAAQPAVCKRIYRARTKQFPAQDIEAISVAYGRVRRNDQTIRGAPNDYQTLIYVDLFARSSTESADVAVDPLLERVGERMVLDTTLGGIVADLNFLELDPENDSEGMETGWIRLTFIAEHRTTNSLFS
jgi:hypothetical protein